MTRLAWSFLTPRRVSPFNARSRFARSTILEEKWGTTRSLVLVCKGYIFSLKKAVQIGTVS